MGRPLLFNKRIPIGWANEQLERVDAWRTDRRTKSGKPISQAEAIRQLVDRGLEADDRDDSDAGLA